MSLMSRAPRSVRVGCFASVLGVLVQASTASAQVTALSVDPIQVVGGVNATGSLTVASAFGRDTTVTLTSSFPAVASVPATITMPPGRTKATFPISTVLSVGNFDVTITAKTGAVEKTAIFRVTGLTPVVALVLSGEHLSGGHVLGSFTVQATVQIGGAPLPGGQTVTFSSSDPLVASIAPATQVIPDGQDRITVDVQTAFVSAQKNVQLTALSGSGNSKTASLAVLSTPYSITSFQTAEQFIAGGNSTTAAVKISAPAPAGGGPVRFTSTNPAVAAVTPDFQIIPAGETSLTVNVETSPVAARTDVDLAARTIGGIATTLRVLPLAIQIFKVDSLNPIAGTPATFTVILNGTALPGGAAIGIALSNSTLAFAPGSITILAGEKQGTFVVETGVGAACADLGVTASYGGVQSTLTLHVGSSDDLQPVPLFTSWGHRNSVTTGGKVLWSEGDDPFLPKDVYLFSGQDVTLIQAGGDLESVTTTVFALGSGAQTGGVLGAWRRGTNDAWLWSSGSQPLLVQAENPLHPGSPMNPEALALGSGCAYFVFQAVDPATTFNVKHVFRVDTATGIATNLTGHASVAGAVRVVTDACRAAWVFNPDPDPNDAVKPARILQFHDGDTVHDLDSGDLGDKPSLAGNWIAYEKDLGGVTQVFLADLRGGGPPAPLSSDPQGRSFQPVTDGWHVAWLHERAGGGLEVVLLGGIAVPESFPRPADNAAIDESFLQISHGQLLWSDRSGIPVHIHDNTFERICVAPAASAQDAWLAEGSIAFRGTGVSGRPDTDPLFHRGRPTEDDEGPQPPILLVAEGGNGDITLTWDSILGASSYNLYLAQAPGVAKDGFVALPGGARRTNVASPFTLSGLENGVTFYFVVTALQGDLESKESGEAHATPIPPWISVPGTAGAAFWTVAADPGDGSVAHAAGGSKVLLSTDGGFTFTSQSNLADGAVDFRALAARGALVLGVTRQGDVYRSGDRGQGWSLVFSGGDTGEQAKSLLIDPRDASTIYAGDFAAATVDDSLVVKSLNGGDSFSHLPQIPGGDIRAYALALDAAGVLFAGGSGTPAIVKSADGGASWKQAELSPPALIYTLAAHPGEAGVLFAGTSDSGIFRTLDAGLHWESKNVGLPAEALAVKSILIDPLRPQVLFAGTAAGVFRSADGGGRWDAFQRGLGPLEINALALTPARRLIAATQSGLYLVELDRPQPPDIPAGLTATGLDQEVVLEWDDTPAGSPPIAGYNVYRSAGETGPFSKVTPFLVAESRFADTTVANHVLYCYQVEAVGRTGVISARPAAACATPEAPVTELPFRRADVTSDGKVDITDAIRLLGFLFLGADPPPCEDAADADDSGTLVITDAISILGWLFLGGNEPPAPGPHTCGPDTTVDSLACGGYEHCSD